MAPYIQEIPSSLNLWEQQTHRSTVENSYIDIINPQSGFEAKTNGSLKFTIPGNDTFINLFKSNIYLKLKLTGKTTLSSTDYTVKTSEINKTGLSVINNIAHSLFKSVKVRIANQDLTVSDDQYGYKAYLQLLLNSTKESQETYFRVNGWLKDKAPFLNAEMKSDGSCENNALLERRTEYFTSDDGIGEFFIKPHVGITFLDKCIIPYTDLEFELARHDNSDFYLMHKGTSHDFNIEILEARFWVQRYKCNPNFVSDVEKMLFEHPLEYRINDSYMNNFSIPQGISNYSNDNLFYNGNIPQRVIFLFVPTASFNGNATKNPFNFQHLKIQSFRLMKNGLLYPTPEIVTNFQTQPYQFIPAYNLFMKSIGADYNSHTTSITPFEYHNGFYINSFLMTPDQESGSDLVSQTLPSQIRVELRFAEPLTEPIQMLVYFENQTSLIINAKREPIILHQ